jgi:hypothetical protein
MKSTITKVSTITVLYLAVLIVISTALAEPVGNPVSGSGETVLNFATGNALGNGTIAIRGTEMAVEIEVQLLGPPVESDDGTLHADVMHIFTFANGVIITNDKAILDPIEGGYNMNERVTIIGGMGAFANVSGNLTVHGQVMFQPPSVPPGPPMADVSYDIHGVIYGY